MTGAIAEGRAPAMFITPRSFATLTASVRTSATSQVNSHVQPEAESTDGHADEEAFETLVRGNYEHPEAQHERGGADGNLAQPRLIGASAAEPGCRHDEDRHDQAREKDPAWDLGRSTPDLLHQVVRLIGGQEWVGQDQHRAQHYAEKPVLAEFGSKVIE